MIEAMTEGGFKKRGVVFLPQDALTSDSIVLKYAQDFAQKIEILRESKNYSLGNIKFITSPLHIHPVETYGLKFYFDKKIVAIITDTRYFPQIKDFYKADILIVSVVFYAAHNEVDHLSLDDAVKIIQEIRPKLAILTHFGMTMLKAKPHLIAEDLQKRLKVKVIAAYDGLKLDLSNRNFT
jgi:ribonuclease BN (tRNA processing enzyme)